MILRLFVDGGVISKNPSPFGGTWAYIILDERGNIYRSGSGAFRPHVFGMDIVTNHHTELYAMLRGLATLPPSIPALIHSDSKNAIGLVSQGWKWNKKIPTHFHTLFQEELRYRLKWWPIYEFIHLDGHPTRAHLEFGIGKRGNPVSPHNVWCDKACTDAGVMLMSQSADTYEKITGESP